MPQKRDGFDRSKFINAAQVGGIEHYTINDGEGRGVRALCVNTGGGLRYRVLVDRGLDIDHASFNQHSLTYLTHKGVTRPTRALDQGLGWLKSFPGGLLTSCGPFNIGPPTTDQGEELGLHGPHSNTAAGIESVIQPDPHRNRAEMSITGTVRYGKLFGPNVELRRTIRSRLGQNSIWIEDDFFNAGNEAVPHAWLLHINFGYPLLDEGARFCYRGKAEPRPTQASEAYFRSEDYRAVLPPSARWNGTREVCGYLTPTADRKGLATVALVNAKLGLGLAIRYDTRQFPRVCNWQHFGRGEYVAALEPMTATVDGRDKDRARGLLATIKPGGTTRYEYEMRVVSDRDELERLLDMR